MNIHLAVKMPQNCGQKYYLMSLHPTIKWTSYVQIPHLANLKSILETEQTSDGYNVAQRNMVGGEQKYYTILVIMDYRYNNTLFIE